MRSNTEEEIGVGGDIVLSYRRTFNLSLCKLEAMWALRALRDHNLLFVYFKHLDSTLSIDCMKARTAAGWSVKRPL